MIKIKDISKYKLLQRKTSLKQAKRRAKYKAWRRWKNKIEQGIPKPTLVYNHRLANERWQYKDTVHAPSNFSFIENTEDVVKFIDHLDKLCMKRERVFVDLRRIINIDYGAIVTLLSIMVKFKAANIKFGGNFPDDPVCKELLIRSGFFENMWKTIRDEDRYAFTQNKAGGIHTHARKHVDQLLSALLIHSAAFTVWGEDRRCQGVQRALIELMQNTNNHAEIGKKGQKHWWLSVHHKQEEEKACFAFVDFGVGVFKSLANKPENSKWANWGNALAKRLIYGNNIELLRLILSGDFHHTVTGKHYRGKGLPGIADVQRRNQMSNLIIVTNDVYCCYDKALYRRLDTPFNGTFIYWELIRSNDSCKGNN